jgi:hypothetical protein
MVNKKPKPENIPSFNPLDKRNIGESLARAVLKQDIGPLQPEKPFTAAGVYLIYYIGSFSPYREIAEKNRDNLYQWPIYVGKAVPAGRRKGGSDLDAKPGQALYNRLCEHADSVDKAENLDRADFICRFLAVDDVWISLTEFLLVERFSPLWNGKVDGFGNHDPGSGRYNQKRSPWDTVHPGRPWAYRLQPNKLDRKTILEKTEEFIVEARHKISAPLPG